MTRPIIRKTTTCPRSRPRSPSWVSETSHRSSAFSPASCVVKVVDIRYPDNPEARADAEKRVLSEQHLEFLKVHQEAQRRQYVVIHEKVLDSLDYEADRPTLEDLLEDKRIVAEVKGGGSGHRGRPDRLPAHAVLSRFRPCLTAQADERAESDRPRRHAGTEAAQHGGSPGRDRQNPGLPGPRHRLPGVPRVRRLHAESNRAGQQDDGRRGPHSTTTRMPRSTRTPAC